MEEGQAQEQPDALALMSQYLDSQEPKEESPAEAPTEAAQPETEAEEVQAEATTETTSEEAPQPKPKFKLKVKREGGEDEEVEVDEDELKSGYMRQSDYQRKTAEVAREREAVEHKVKASVEPVLKQYQERLQLFERAVWNQIAPEIQNTDWNALARDNPAEWAQRMQQVNNVNALLNNVRSELQKVDQMKQQEQQQTKQKQVREAVEVLQREIPGWNNDVYQKVMQTGIELGYKPEQVAEITDPIAIKALHLAGKMRELEKAKPAVEKRVAEVPKTIKPGTTGKSDANADKKAEAFKRLRKSGRQEDAVAAILHSGLV